MKKLVYSVMVIMMFLLAGCDKDNNEIDMSQSSGAKSHYDEETIYGPIVHAGVIADSVVIKNLKYSEDLYTYAIGIKADKPHNAVVALICDHRLNGAVITYSIKNDGGVVPNGRVDISIMKYRPGVKDIRETDEDADPIFSTANGDTDFLAGVRKAAGLPADTMLAFVIDKDQEDGSSKGIAWTSLFTAKQLDKALSGTKDKCGSLKLDLNDTYIVAAKDS